MSDLQIHETENTLEEEAAVLRGEIVQALHSCGGGHYGGSLSVLDILLTLYRKFLRISTLRPDHPERDRLILSKGHAAIAYYAVLHRIGFISTPLEEYGQFQSPYEGHPDMLQVPGVDFSTGSLGQGLSVGLGMALALRGKGPRVWVILGDGECQEGQVWEAAMLASRYGADNLCAIVDCNKYQEWGWNDDGRLATGPLLDPVAKWSAFGWEVLETDGHDPDQLIMTFTRASAVKSRPVVVIANTIKGKGYAAMESDPRRFHCCSADIAERTIQQV
jgi:transketolase